MRQIPSLAALPILLALAACGSEAPAPVATVSASAAAIPSAAAPVTAEAAAKVAAERHDGFETIGKAMKTVTGELKASTPDVAKIQEASATIERLAPQVAGWFPAGSGPDVIPKTEALPAIWEKPVEFSAAAQKFVDESGSFHRTAMAGNVAAIGGGLKALGGSCKGCHEQFRKPD